MPYCYNCGTEIDLQAKYCTRCGKDVSQVAKLLSQKNKTSTVKGTTRVDGVKILFVIVLVFSFPLMAVLPALLLLLPIVLVVWFVLARRRSCPSCKKWWQRKKINQELLNTYGAWETVQDIVTTNSDNYDTHGNRTGTSSSSSFVPRTAYVRHYTYEEKYRCKSCSFEWSAIVERKSE